TQRGGVVGNRLELTTASSEHTATVEVSPGEFGPETDALAEVRRGEQVFAQFLVTDTALHHRPVMLRVEPERLVELGQRSPPAIDPSLTSVGRRERVVIAGRGRRCGLGEPTHSRRLEPVAESLEFLRTLEPECAGGG